MDESEILKTLSQQIETLKLQVDNLQKKFHTVETLQEQVRTLETRLQQYNLLQESSRSEQTIEVSEESQVSNAIQLGINYGTVHAVWGDVPPDNGKELLDNYLKGLISRHSDLQLGKLLMRDASGQGQLTRVTFNLDELYTWLATNGHSRVVEQHLLSQISSPSDVEHVRSKVETEFNPTWVLPEQVRVAVLQIGDEIDLPPGSLLNQWQSFLKKLEVAGQDETANKIIWYRPELAAEAIAAHKRLLLFGSPGSGKSTVLHYLISSLARALLGDRASLSSIPGWDVVEPLPVPLFCPLSIVAKQMSEHNENHPDDVHILFTELLRPVEKSGVRQGIRDSILHSWRTGSVLLCLDGLDDVPIDTHSSRNLRSRILQAIYDLDESIGDSRIVITCRTQTNNRKIRSALGPSWQERTLEPFTFGQVRHFVHRWYRNTPIGTDTQTIEAQSEAGERAKHVLTILEQPRLKELVSSPLLATMIVALLDYDRKQHPVLRVDVYEELVNLLLDRWPSVRSLDRSHRSGSIGERLGYPQLTGNDIRHIIHEIAFEAHHQGVDEQGVLSGSMMLKKLEDFFASRSDRATGWQLTRTKAIDLGENLLHLLTEETGLFQQIENGKYYKLPHLTFREYLAACHLADQKRIELIYDQWCQNGEYWREIILLLMERLLQQKQDMMAYCWLLVLVATRYRQEEKENEQFQRDILFAAECYDRIKRREVLGKEIYDIIGFEEQLKHAIVRLVGQVESPLSFAQRLHGVRILGDLGDSRFPVTIDQWKQELTALRKGSTEGYLCYVATGTYFIGDDDPEADTAEKPQHTISFDTPFWIGRYLITNAQWNEWCRNDAEGKPSRFAGDAILNVPNQPVVGVSWEMCCAFCAWLSSELDVTVRLPTEFEWEAAARGGDTRRYPWGDQWQKDCAATREDAGMRPVPSTVPVGCYPAGAAPCGALDMAGNVWEWTNSEWQYYTDAPKPFNTGNQRVLRGGAFNVNPKDARCTTRMSYNATSDIFNRYGFRIVVIMT